MLFFGIFVFWWFDWILYSIDETNATQVYGKLTKNQDGSSFMYGNPPWKTRALSPSRPFRRVFPSHFWLEIRTPDREAESSEDGLTPPTEYHCSCSSLIALRRSTVRLTQARTSVATWKWNGVPTWLQVSYTALAVMLSEIAVDSVKITTPESEKEFLWVKWQNPARNAGHHPLHLQLLSYGPDW